MQTHADNTSKPTNGIANNISAGKENAPAESMYHPDTVFQRKSADLNNNNTEQINAYQAMANSSAQVKQGMQLQAMADNRLLNKTAALSENGLGLESMQEAGTTTAAPVQRAIKRSNRIASNNQRRARADRPGRAARYMEVIRFVANQVNTYRAIVPGLGGGYGLVCPPGSYIRKRRNFAYLGSRAADFAALGVAAPGFVWHHYHDFVPTPGVANSGTGTMYLLSNRQHARAHRGGVWQWNNTPGNAAYG